MAKVNDDYYAFEGDPSVVLDHLDGVRNVEGVMRVRPSSGSTLVFNDAVFNMPHGRGVPGFIFRHITGSTGGPRVTRLFRMMAVKDKAAFRVNLQRLAGTPELKRIIVSHHEPITDRPAEVLHQIAAAL